MTTRSTILLVEDDYLIQLHARIALEDAGYAVLLAVDGQDALARAGTPVDIAALFTDICLPGPIDGLALAHDIRRTRPDAAIVVTSGQHQPDAGKLPDGAAFLAKPYTAAQMCRILDRHIGR